MSSNTSDHQALASTFRNTHNMCCLVYKHWYKVKKKCLVYKHRFVMCLVYKHRFEMCLVYKQI